MPTKLETVEHQTLKNLASELRLKVVEMSHFGKSAHLGSCLSTIEIMTVLYFDILELDPRKPNDETRDVFIMSKGHAAMSLYATLAKRGYFPERNLQRYNLEGEILTEHPPAFGVPGVEAATGSLGHGLPIAVGQALGKKIKQQNNKVYCLISDGEANEGSIWESAMFASAQNLSNLTVFMDYNKWQATGRSCEILNTTPHAPKWHSFGWNVEEVDGHDIDQLIKAAKKPGEGPKIVIAETIKGKGFSFMEDDNNWHYKIPTELDLQMAKKELGL
jgi:transketolase